MKTKENNKLKDKNILVIVTGSIAAVKTPLLISNLVQAGSEVKCVVTSSASQLVSPLSLATLSRNRCYQDQDQWNPKEPKPLHIALAEWADIIVVAPLSASSLSRWVTGNGEGLASSILLASEKPFIAAAAMNTAMWDNPMVQKNWKYLQSLKNIITLAPSKGLLACDRIGDGRMTSPELIQLAIESAAIRVKNNLPINKDFEHINFLVSAGPTIEDIDSARYLSNRSSGKMGVLLAQAARLRGAQVTLIHGPMNVETSFLEGIKTYETRNAEEMQKILNELQPSADLIAMTAAVSDIKLKENSSKLKIPKQELLGSLHEKLEIAPDLLAGLVKNRKKQQIIVGFTALTGEGEEIQKCALIKKNLKGCDILIANPIDKVGQGFESDFNEGWLIGPENKIEKLPLDCKLSIAHQLLDIFKKVLMIK